MDVATDEDEHSIEMHLPYVRKIFEGYAHPHTMVPGLTTLVGRI